MSFPPDAAHHRNLAGDMDADQIGALAGRDLATVGKPHRFGGVFCHRTDGRGKIDRRHPLWQLQRRHQQARGNVVGRQDVQQPPRARSTAAMLPECEPPRTTLGAPIRMPMPARCRPRAASTVVGNSATETRSLLASVTFSSVVSSWLASGIWY